MKKKLLFWITSLLFTLLIMSTVSAVIDWDDGSEVKAFYTSNKTNATTLQDWSPNDNHATLTGSDTINGDWVQFDGTFYYRSGSNSGLTSAAKTVCAWANYTGDAAGYRSLIEAGSRSTSQLISLAYDSGAPYNMLLTNYGASISTTKDSSLALICGTNDGSTGWEIFYNGSSQTSGTQGNSYTDNLITLGAWGDASGKLNNVEISQWMVFNKELTPTEMNTIVSNGPTYNPYDQPTAGTDNFSTVQTASYSFTTPVTISGSYGTINSQTITSDNETSPFYFTTSMTLNSSGSTNAECRIDIGGTKYATTTRSLSANTLGNLKLMTEQITLPIGDHIILTECQKTGGGPNYIVTNSDMVEVHLHDVNTNQTINNQYVNGTGLSVNTTVQELASFSFTTSNITGTTNNNTVIVHGVASFSYDNNDNITAYLQVQETGEVCGNYTRYGASGSSGSVGTMCGFKDLNSSTTYNFTFYGSSAVGTGTINNLRMHAYNLRTTTTATNNTGLQKVVPAATDTEVANISITNSQGGSFTVFVDAGIMVSGAAQDAYFYLENTEESIKYYRTLSPDGNGNINTQYSFDETGTDTMNYTLQAYCPSGCTISGGDLTAFVAEQDAAAPDTLVVTAYDAWNNNSITSFNVTIGGATVSSNATGIATITTSGTQNITLSATNYFTTTVTNYNTSTNLNTSLIASEIAFTTTEYYSGNTLTNITYFVTGQGAIQTNGTFYLAAGNYNVTASKTGYFDVTQAITVTGKDNLTTNIPHMYDATVNFTFYNSFTNATVSATWVATYFNTSYGDTSTNGSYISLSSHAWAFSALSSTYQSFATTLSLAQGVNNYEFYLNESAIWLSFSETTNITVTSTDNVETYENITLYVALADFAEGIITISWGEEQLIEYYNTQDSILHANIKVLENTTALDPSRTWLVLLNGEPVEFARIYLEQQNSSEEWEIVSGKLTDNTGNAIIGTVGEEIYRVTVTYGNYTRQYIYPVTAGDTDTQIIEFTEINNYYGNALLSNTSSLLVGNTTYGFTYVCNTQSCLIEEVYVISYANGTIDTTTTTRSGTTTIEWTHETPGTFDNISMTVTTFEGEVYTRGWGYNAETEAFCAQCIIDRLKSKPLLAIALFSLPLLILIPLIENKVQKGWGKYVPLGWYSIIVIFAPILGVIVIIAFIIQLVLPLVRKQMENG